METLGDCARRFVKTLPETPYSAIGLNFMFAVPAATLKLDRIVSPMSDNLLSLFGPDYVLGAKVTFTYEGFMVRAEIPTAPVREGLAEISFNFHADIAGAAAAIELIGKHQSAWEKAQEIVGGVVGND